MNRSRPGFKCREVIFYVFIIIFDPFASRATGVEQLAGSLRQYLLDYPIQRIGTNRYIPPSADEIDAFRIVVDEIIAGQLESATSIAETLNYRTILFDDTDNDGVHIVLIEFPPDTNRTWRGIYVFNKSPSSRVRKLVFESPHPLSDLNTKAETIDLYIETSAAALIMAGAHKRNLSSLSPCDGTYRISDMAHVSQSFFQAAHEQIYFGYPDTVTISVHGMSPKSPPHDVSVSNGTEEDITGQSLSKDIVDEMNRLIAVNINDQRIALSHQKAGTNAALPGTTNTQGRFTNGSADPCSVSVSSAIQPERFIHMEQTVAVRETQNHYAFVIQTFKNLFDFLEPLQYVINVKTVGKGSVALDPEGGIYASGEMVQLTAIPDPGEQFVEWIGDLTGTNNPTDIVMDSDKSVSAVFGQVPKFILAVNTIGYGSVALNPPGGEYYKGTTVELKAFGAPGWSFETWSGDLKGVINPTIITMDTDKTIIAEFNEDYASLPYSNGFESGNLDRFWLIQSSDPSGRIQLTSKNGPHTGVHHLTMDVSKGGSYSTNEAWLHLNLSDENHVDLIFWWKDFNDETHSEDGVFFSDDGGARFVKVYDLTRGSTTWKEVRLPVDELAQANQIDLTSNFVIKFQQRDNYSISTDGFAFDDISVLPRENQAPIANANGPYSGMMDGIIYFNSDGSYDPDGVIVSYLWDFGDGVTDTRANPDHLFANFGTYTITLTVTDDNGVTSIDTTEVSIYDPSNYYATLPYSTGFETGNLDPFWSIKTSNPVGRIQVSNANEPHRGSYHLLMDVNSSGNYATNEAWLRLNLAGETQVDLIFWWKEFNDESHSEDGVYLSDNDGATFVKVFDLVGGSKTWQEIVLDIDNLASLNGMTLSSTFVIKLQHRDNYGISTDGFAFDDISVQ